MNASGQTSKPKRSKPLSKLHPLFHLFKVAAYRPCITLRWVWCRNWLFETVLKKVYLIIIEVLKHKIGIVRPQSWLELLFLSEFFINKIHNVFSKFCVIWVITCVKHLAPGVNFFLQLNASWVLWLDRHPSDLFTFLMLWFALNFIFLWIRCGHFGYRIILLAIILRVVESFCFFTQVINLKWFILIIYLW